MSSLSDFSRVDAALSMGRAELENNRCRLVELRSRRIGIQALQEDRQRLADLVKELRSENDTLRETQADSLTARCDLTSLQQEYDSMVIRSTRWENEQLRLHQRIASLVAEVDGLRGVVAGAALKKQETYSVDIELSQLRGVSSELTQMTEAQRRMESENNKLQAANRELNVRTTARQAEIAQLRLEMVELVSNQTEKQKEIENIAKELVFYRGKSEERLQGELHLKGVLERQEKQLAEQDATIASLVSLLDEMQASQKQLQQKMDELPENPTLSSSESELSAFIKLQDALAREQELQNQLQAIQSGTNDRDQALQAQLQGARSKIDQQTEQIRLCKEIKMKDDRVIAELEQRVGESETVQVLTKKLEEATATIAVTMKALDSEKQNVTRWRGFLLSPEQEQHITEQFEKYDLDDGGTINSEEEMSQLCLNLLFKLNMTKIDGKAVNSAWILSKVRLLPDLQQNPVDLENFKLYFVEEFLRQLPKQSSEDPSQPEPAAVIVQPALPKQASSEVTLPEHLDPIVAEMFDKYDLDEGGTINSEEEMSQLCLALLFKLEVRMLGDQPVNASLVNSKVKTLPDLAAHPMELPQFKEWFTVTFYAHVN